MVDCWRTHCENLGIPSSAQKYSLAHTLGNPVEIRDWQLQGLPSDTVSIDSAILATRGERWPLMIDPQGQANKWIKNMHGPEVTKMNNTNLLRTLEASIRVRRMVVVSRRFICFSRYPCEKNPYLTWFYPERILIR
jgi:dynein heavy chain